MGGFWRFVGDLEWVRDHVVPIGRWGGFEGVWS